MYRKLYDKTLIFSEINSVEKKMKIIIIMMMMMIIIIIIMENKKECMSERERKMEKRKKKNLTQCSKYLVIIFELLHYLMFGACFISIFFVLFCLFRSTLFVVYLLECKGKKWKLLKWKIVPLLLFVSCFLTFYFR